MPDHFGSTALPDWVLHMYMICLHECVCIQQVLAVASKLLGPLSTPAQSRWFQAWGLVGNPHGATLGVVMCTLLAGVHVCQQLLCKVCKS
jgi:hypothetical protein